MPRARSTRADLVRREAEQAEIIAELVLLGADEKAAQLIRCWHGRLFGGSGQHRYRCRSISCGTCRRPPLAAWWRSYRRWAEEGGPTSYVRLAIDDPLTDLATIAKSLRNRRDQIARDSWLYAPLAFLGVADDSHVHLIVSHPGLSRQQVSEQLEALWPTRFLDDAPAEPVDYLSPQLLARLGQRSRAYQPLRFVISPRGY